MPATKVRKIQLTVREPLSIDMPVGERDKPLAEVIADDPDRNPLDDAMDEELRRRIRKALDTLPPRHQEVLRMRYGIDERADHTLVEVGEAFDLTRERIRQIEQQALRKLRHPSRARLLKSFLDK